MNKKINTLAKNGIIPVLEGMINKTFTTEEGGKEAARRLVTCRGCPFFIDEPVEFLAVVDDKLPEASGKMCDECGCAIPLKIRQNTTLCKHWPTT